VGQSLYQPQQRQLEKMAPPRPRWEANKKQAPAKARKAQQQKAVDEAPPPEPAIPVELQQLLLNIFRDSFSKCFEEDVKPLLQEVKGHLYNRDFATAFGKDEYLETYAARWSASRALGYADLFWDLRSLLWPQQDEETEGDEKLKRREIVCLGGGAGAELVALAGVQRMLASEIEDDAAVPKMVVEAVDIADWTSVLDQLTQHVTQPPPLSKYASAAVQAANSALVNPDTFNVSNNQYDILNTDPSKLSATMKDATLVTLMFTLNELYSTSVSLTQKFLLNLTLSLPAGALLLVVDSPGSYSAVTLNGAEKEYPMQWLLDYTLLNQAGDKVKDKDREDAKWEKIHTDESRWFRLAETLKYPIELENMRMQLHLYRRV
jgi:25S rRNA (uracil2843-N3)-methyltransferase